MARTIESPGVQISEVDLSLRPILPIGTNVLVTGFAPQGPTDEILQVTSLSEFEQVYGTPQTPAERYFYHTAAPLFNTAANVSVYRLPYGASNGTGFGANFGALVYPCSAVSIDSTNFGKGLSNFSTQSANVMYFIGKPIHFELTQTQYDDIQQGKNFTWSDTGSNSIAAFSDLGKAGFIVLNKGQTTIDEKFQGFYIGAIDNTNLNPATNFDGLLNVVSVSQSGVATSNYTLLPSTRLNFSLSSLSDNQSSITYGSEGTSVSQIMEDASPFTIATSQYDDTLTVGLFKLRQSVFSPDTIKLDYVFSEKYIGSFDYWRQINSQNGGMPVSYFLETAEDTSPNVQLLINPYISNKNGKSWLTTAGDPSKKVRMITNSFANLASITSNFIAASASFGITSTSQIPLLTAGMVSVYNSFGPADSLFPVGAYADGNLQSKNLGSIPTKLDRLFSIAGNDELYNIDVTLDGGLTTIHAVKEFQGGDSFNDAITVTAIDGLYVTNPENVTAAGQLFKDNYVTVFNRFQDFAGLKRKDHLFVGDLPRHIFVQGNNFKVLDDTTKNFSLNMFSPIKNVTSSLNSSYSTVYANWVKVFDNNLDDICWVPFSGFAAAAMANTDTNFQPWFAPAGFTRGVVNGVADIAIYPKQKQRDQLYKISTNPVTFFPNEGFVIYGQKTLLKKPSAFDRINVRRLFLNLEKATASTSKFFVFEPNTLLTRTRVINTLRPIFENAKNTEGLYDYLIVCDERNNTPDIIDQNELVVDIYLKPVRTAEFILVNFYATRTGTNFNELVG